jgi:pyruvate formate-lyase activating enzyme-like uncharacterized protein
MIENTKYFSKLIGKLPNGCKYCVKGQKLVLFVTGLCPRRCFYCPLSEDKKFKDVIFANERPVSSDKDIIEEAKLMSAKGAGITGGDPLVTLDRTIKYIKLLKKEFGEHFHIHLYTPLDLVSKERLKALYEVGLDEIRFHPDFEKPEEWERILIAKEFDWDYGLEIPVLPNYVDETKRLIEFASGHIKFLNLNELEISETNVEAMLEHNFIAKDDISYAVLGSEELAIELMGFSERFGFNVHYCTVKLKDGVQLRNRIKRIAKNISKPFDKVTEEGMLIRGVIYLQGLEPGFDYKQRLKNADKEKSLKELGVLKDKVAKQFNIPDRFIEIDKKKLRVLTRARLMQNISKKIKNKCAIVEEYPTYDGFEVDIDFLN